MPAISVSRSAIALLVSGARNAASRSASRSSVIASSSGVKPLLERAAQFLLGDAHRHPPVIVERAHREAGDPRRPVIILDRGVGVHERPVAAAPAGDPRRQHVRAQRLQEALVARRGGVAAARADHRDRRPGRAHGRDEDAELRAFGRRDPLGRRVGTGAQFGRASRRTAPRSAPPARRDRRRRPRSGSPAPANNKPRRAAAAPRR